MIRRRRDTLPYLDSTHDPAISYIFSERLFNAVAFSSIHLITSFSASRSNTRLTSLRFVALKLFPSRFELRHAKSLDPPLPLCMSVCVLLMNIFSTMMSEYTVR